MSPGLLMVILSLLARAPQELLDGLGIVAHFRAEEKSRENLYLVASWETYEKGQKRTWSDDTFHVDSLGRIRLRQETGAFDAQQRRIRLPKQPVYSDKLFDGEKTISVDYFSDLDRIGMPTAKDSGKAGYWRAQIQDGNFPPPHGLFSIRNPINFLSGSVQSDIEPSIQLKQRVKVERSPDSANVLIVDFDAAPYAGNTPDRCVASIDTGAGWIVTEYSRFDAVGRLLRRMECQYLSDDTGRTVPSEGFLRQFDPKDAEPRKVPLWEWRFKVREIAVNDPKFDESVFAVALEPDTAVSDLRYAVNYRVGAQEARDSDLMALAEEAKKRLGATAPSGIPSTSNRGWLIGINLGVILLLVVVMILRYKRTWTH